MPTPTKPSLLRKALVLDAITALTLVLTHTSAATYLEAWLGTPAPLLYGASGVSALAATIAAFLASRERPSRAGVGVLVALNLAWVLASAWVLGVGVALTRIGTVWVTAQGAFVLVLSAVEWYGARAPATAAPSLDPRG